MNATNKTDVLAATDAFYTALNAMFTGDAGPMEVLWSEAEDVTYMPPMGGTLRGRAAIEASWEQQAALKLGGSIASSDVSAVVGADLAVVTSVGKGENPDAPGGPMRVEVRATHVYRLEGGRWKLIHFHVDPIAAMAGS